jgi:hypothetical protein
MEKMKLLALAFLVAVGFNSCNMHDNISLNDGVDESFFVEFNMNGKSLILREGKDGYMSRASSSKSNNPSNCMEEQMMVISKEADINKSFTVKMREYASSCATQCSQIENMYKVGSYSFCKNAAEPSMNGVVIAFTDHEGTYWASDLGNADQSNSRFEIMSHRPMNHKMYRNQTEAVFSCRLYNEKGDEMLLTDGKMKSRSVTCGHMNMGG